MGKISNSFCNLTWSLLITTLLVCILATVLNELILPQSQIWSHIYYHVHSKCILNGYLTIIDQTQQNEDGEANEVIYHFGNMSESPHSTIIIKDIRYFRHVVLDIDIGLGESYVSNYWESADEDISKYLRLLFLNYQNKQSQFYFYYLQCFSFSQWFNIYSYYYWNEHTVFNDQHNIHHHYDWGVQLFQSFLDSTMTYTAANFVENEVDDLEGAQINKVDRLIRKMDIQNEDNVLEIGFGFGYLASRLLNTTNAASITGITLSHDQLEYANNRYIKHSNHSRQPTYLYRDYRHYLNGDEKFNSIVSVEMIEAIGHESIDTYFETISNSLVDGGRFVIQYGAYSTWAFPEFYQKEGIYFPTFVVKHIFPAHFEPSEQEIHASALKHGLELVHEEKFGLHYAKTLEIWLNNLIENKQSVVSTFGEDTFRTFSYYLAWSQAVYQTQILHEIQAVFRKTSEKDIGHDLGALIYSL